MVASQSIWMLFLGVIFLLISTWLFWPKKGLIAKFLTMKSNTQRMHLEDALKYLFDCEYRNKDCNMDSIAGNLNITGDTVSSLVDRLLKMELVTLENQKLHLTDQGRSYSLRVIRVHRIWERYLADETGVAEKDWHNEADILEHVSSYDDTEELAAKMGNPVFDPHGDPIPTTSGKLPTLKGQLLSQLKKGDIGRIIHIEDEPKSIYEQLVVEGLHPGMQLYILDSNDDKITFVAEGNERSLTPLFATQITLEILSKETPITEKHELLSSLKEGEHAKIMGISLNCRGQQRRRLMDLGIISGSQIALDIKSASGDPVGYRVMNTTIGIRKEQANFIFIKKNIKNGSKL